MPIIKSARKRVKVAAKASTRNAKTKRAMREAIKAYSKALEAGNAKNIAETQRQAFSAIDTATKKDIIHKNKAARAKASLAARAKKSGAKVTAAAKAPAKKTPAKKAAPAAKKPAAKKSTTKKPTTKKTLK
jgi:small subunit ribosomal protein S20